MGNTNSGANSPSLNSRRGTSAQDSSSKEIHIRTDRTDGFYFNGEILTGSFEIPISYFHQHLNGKKIRKLSELFRRGSLTNLIAIELVGEAIYSAEVDAAADSDGHATHQVNLCRQPGLVKLNIEYDQAMETSLDNGAQLPSNICGHFQLEIPGGLPPSLSTNRPPMVTYHLELNLSTSRNRYQIPIVLSSKGSFPNRIGNLDLSCSAINQHEICLQANLLRAIYHVGEQIPVRISYSNPHQRSIRSITLTLHQFYRIHHDQSRCQLDGKEWNFDLNNLSSPREWVGEAFLQLPNQNLPATYKTESVGTTQSIECELDYRIFVELNEKKGEDIHLTLPSIQVTYQTS